MYEVLSVLALYEVLSVLALYEVLSVLALYDMFASMPHIPPLISALSLKVKKEHILCLQLFRWSLKNHCVIMDKLSINDESMYTSTS